MNEPELIAITPDRWLVRTSTSTGSENSKGQVVRTVTSELVYGQLQNIKSKNDVTISAVVGTCHHKLHGPTAEKSIQEMADNLNAKGYVPEGPKDHRPEDFEQSLLTGEMLQQSISYGPNWKGKRK